MLGWVWAPINSLQPALCWAKIKRLNWAVSVCACRHKKKETERRFGVRHSDLREQTQAHTLRFSNTDPSAAEPNHSCIGFNKANFVPICLMWQLPYSCPVCYTWQLQCWQFSKMYRLISILFNTQLESGVVYYEHQIPEEPFWVAKDSIELTLSSQPAPDVGHILPITISYYAAHSNISSQLWKNKGNW